MNAFVHRAWMATYQPGWDPNGPWKWFWKVSNWEPPIPFKNFVEMVVLVCFLFLFQDQKLVRSGDCHGVLAACVFDAGIDKYVCDSNAHEDRSFVLLLGNDAGTT